MADDVRGRSQQAAKSEAAFRSVRDRVAFDEIELYAELIIAAERSAEPLSQEEIDRIIGVQAEGSRPTQG